MFRFLVAMVVVAAAAAAPGAAPGSRLSAAKKTPSIQDEMRAWTEGGYPDSLQFPDDTGKPVWGAVVVDPSDAAVKGLFRDINNPFDDSVIAIGDNVIMASDDDVKFHIYTKSNNYSSVEGTRVSLNQSEFVAAGWDPTLPAKVVIHGFTNSIESPIIQDIKNGTSRTPVGP
ncbi:Stabilin-1 [Frankliniella fusca]|uniref:Stabilin-1 n=1 Tax=Frankliniella fusca TaxID=407009 RepID=A0AAE1H9C7_9NEOP|nr:Stabilin-1 [Frankliniella fusca]